jgi:hypothetical protein
MDCPKDNQPAGKPPGFPAVKYKSEKHQCFSDLYLTAGTMAEKDSLCSSITSVVQNFFCLFFFFPDSSRPLAPLARDFFVFCPIFLCAL